MNPNRWLGIETHLRHETMLEISRIEDNMPMDSELFKTVLSLRNSQILFCLCLCWVVI